MSDLEDLTQVLQRSVQELVGFLQTLAALLGLGAGERVVQVRGSHPEPREERVAGRHLVGVIRNPLGRLSGLGDDLDQLHDLQDGRKGFRRSSRAKHSHISLLDPEGSISLVQWDFSM